MSLNLLRTLLKNRKPRRRDDQKTPALGTVERLEDRAMLAAVFINEIHYDNAGGDVGEFIEIAGPAGTDVNGWTLVLYNGSNNGTYTPTQTLSGTIPNEGGTGFGTIAVNYAANGIQNGAPDGVALVNAQGVVVEFISYEGTITASGGPADGMTSVDIGVSQSGSDPIGLTLQRIGTGTVSTDFTWTGPVDDSPGAINSGQTFIGGVGADTTPPVLAASDPFDPDDGSTNVPVGSNLTVRFSEAVQLSNSGTITVFRSSDNTVLGQYDLATSSGTLAVSVSGDALTINPDSDLPADTAVYIQISAGAIQDTSGNSFAGITDTSTWDFVTAAAISGGANVWLNEIHYDNAGSDVGEFIEVAGTAGTDLTGYTVLLYNGSNGTVYDTIVLSGTIDDEGNGFGALSFTPPAGSIQNGSPDGFALVNPMGNVIEFFSYEGTITATDGPASGQTSTDMGVSEAGTEPTGQSLQRDNTTPGTPGNWSGPSPETPGSLNIASTGAPDINVQGQATDILDGDTSPSTTDGTDFGSTATSGGTVTRTFTIQNTGAAPLNVTGITFSGAAAGDFSTTFTTATIPANGSTTFDVIFDPTADGVRAATINIASNDTDVGVYDFAITGTGTSTPSGPNVVISEIMYNPSSADGASPNGEWIEIVNIGTVAADIGGWFFSDEDGDWGPIEAGTMLAPGQVAVIFDGAFTDASTFRFQWAVPAEALVIGVTWGNLSNSPTESNEVLVLLDGSLNIMDTANYDDEGDWPVDDGRGSIYLIDLASDNNVGTNWALSTIGVNDARSPGGDPYSTNDVGTPGTVPGANDSTPPGLAADPFTPADDLTGVSVNTTLTINFNETVQAGSGNIVIRNVDTNSVIETIPVGSGQVSIIGPTVTITPSSPLPLDTNISIQIASGVFEDTSGNDFAGFTDDTTWNFATAASSAPPSVVISEIMYNPAGDGDGSSPFSEWVEIVNTGSEAVDISGWYLADEDGNWGALPVGTMLDPGQVAVIFDTLIVSGDASQFRAAWSIPAEALVIGVTWGSLANGGSDTNEVLVLRNSSGEIIDTANYEDGTNDWPASTNGLSIYVTALGVDNNVGANWTHSAFGVNGGRNPVSLFDAGNVGSPGTVPGVSDNTPPELAAAPFTPADNLTGVSVNTPLIINFTETVQAGTGNIVVRNLDTNTVIETIAVGSGQVTISGPTVTITLSSPLPLNTNISVQVASGVFEDTSGNVFAGFTDDTTWNFATVVSPTPPSIVISEIMYNPAGEDGGSPVDEWVEIVNTGSEAVDISGWFLSDEDGNWGAMPLGTLLNPGQVAVIFDTLNGSETDFRAEWSIPAEALVIGVSWGSLSNSASDTNEVLVLRNSSNEVIDTANYEAGANDWPASTNGVSIFLTDLALDNNVGSNWTLSVSGDNGAINPQGILVSAFDIGSPGRVPGGSVVDTTPPELTSTNPLSPADDATGVGTAVNLSVTFNEIVQLSNSGTITIFRASDNSVLGQYDLASATGTLAVSVSGNTLTINPDSDLPASTAVYVQISAGAVQDTSGNNFAGITDTTTWNFTTAGTTPTSTIVINEVDADTPGTDVLEFVELYDGGAGNTSLNGMVLVFYNGSNDQSYFALDLTGFSTNAQGFFVAGNSGVANVQAVFPDGTLQNGQDAVALYFGSAGDFPNGTAVTNLNLIDAVVYDTNDADDSGLLDVLTPGQPQINESENNAGDVESIARVPNGGTALNTSTYVAQAPTPGASNVAGGGDTTAPTLTSIARQTPSQELTNSASVTFQVVFSEDVTGVDAGDFVSTGGGTIGNVSGSGTTYTVTVNGLGSVNGTVGLALNSPSIQDTSSNALTNLTPGSSQTYTLDTIAPAVVSLSPLDNASGVSTGTTLTITFNGPVIKGSGSIQVLNTTTPGTIETINVSSAQVTVSGSTVTISLSSALPANTGIAVVVPGSALTDAAGNAFAGIANDGSWTFTTASNDNTAPTITSINRQTPAGQAVNIATYAGGPVVFRVTFSEDVQNVDMADFAAAGISGASISGVSTVNASTYDVSVTGLSAVTGTLSIGLVGSPTIQDLVGNALTNTTPATAQTYMFDTIAPTLTSITRGGAPQQASASEVTFTVTFSEIVSGVGAADFAVTGTAGGSIGTVSGSGTTYTVTVTGLGSTTGTVGIGLNSPTITDVLANPLSNIVPTSGTNESYTVDTLGPSVVSLAPNDNATNVSPGAVLVITFDGPIIKGSGSIQIIDLNNGNNVIDTINVSSAQVTVSGNTATITPTSSLPLNASLAVQVAGSAFTDSLGNGFAGISGTTAWNFTTAATDTVAPTILSLTPADNATGVAVSSPLTIQFSETVSKGSGSIVIRNTTTNAVVETIAISSSQVVVSGSTVTITPSATLPSDASLAVQISVGAFVDAASNAFAGIANDTTWNFSTVGAPTVVLSSAVGSETLGPFTVTATFSQAVTGFTSTDVSVNNGTVSNFTAVNAQTFTFVVTPSPNTAGTVISVSLPAGAAQSGSVNSLASNVITTTVGVATSPTQNTIVVTAQASGGGTLLVRDAQTGELRYSLTPFTTQLSIPGFFLGPITPSTGGLDAALADLNGDGVDDIVVGAGPGQSSQIVIYDGLSGTELRRISVFPGGNRFGVNVALADVNSDGVADIVAATASGTAQVRILNGADLISTGAVVELANFSPYPGFTGGVDVAAADMNGDGYAEVITGARAGGGPHVKVFSGIDLGQGGRTVALASFFAYDAAFTGGVNVAVGDINGDSTPDVITGAGAGGGPHVRVFSGASLLSGGLAEVASFFAYDPRFAGGVDVGAGDVNGDGKEDVFTAAGPGGGPHVKVFSGGAFVQSGSAVELDSYFAFGSSFTGGVRLAAGNGGSALTASSLGSAAGGSTVSASALAATTLAAQDAWRSAGLSAAGLAKLNAAKISVTDLPGQLVGLAVGDSIYIDVDAAGHGWNSSSDADSDDDRLDLLTAISHEFGHLLGLDDSIDDADSVMAALLSPGDRRLPTVDDLEEAFARWGQN